MVRVGRVEIHEILDLGHRSRSCSDEAHYLSRRHPERIHAARGLISAPRASIAQSQVAGAIRRFSAQSRGEYTSPLPTMGSFGRLSSWQRATVLM